LEESVEDVAPHFFFPPRPKPLFISPEPLSYYIYVLRDLDISLFQRSIVLKYAELLKTIYNIGSVNTEP
jgi:hypothetical protein